MLVEEFSSNFPSAAFNQTIPITKSHKKRKFDTDELNVDSDGFIDNLRRKMRFSPAREGHSLSPTHFSFHNPPEASAPRKKKFQEFEPFGTLDISDIGARKQVRLSPEYGRCIVPSVNHGTSSSSSAATSPSRHRCSSAGYTEAAVDTKAQNQTSVPITQISLPRLTYDQNFHNSPPKEHGINSTLQVPLVVNVNRSTHQAMEPVTDPENPYDSPGQMVRYQKDGGSEFRRVLSEPRPLSSRAVIVSSSEGENYVVLTEQGQLVPSEHNMVNRETMDMLRKSAVRQPQSAGSSPLAPLNKYDFLTNQEQQVGQQQQELELESSLEPDAMDI